MGEGMGKSFKKIQDSGRGRVKIAFTMCLKKTDYKSLTEQVDDANLLAFEYECSSLSQ